MLTLCPGNMLVKDRVLNLKGLIRVIMHQRFRSLHVVWYLFSYLFGCKYRWLLLLIIDSHKPSVNNYINNDDVLSTY